MERRLAAILAADVVGYTRLMGADETGTLRRLTELRQQVLEPLIAEHHGRVVKLMGDGLLVEFASVVDALTCAVGWQNDVAAREAETDEDRRLQFRIGINIGDIIVEGEDIYGDGVNIAARLEGLAEPGGVCVSGTVFDHVKGKVELDFADQGEQQVKNVAEPVRVYGVGPHASGGGPASLAGEPLSLPDKPSIAVLPLTSMSSDPKHEFFADGIAEEIITALSRVPDLFVIARNSTFTYKGRAVRVQDVARELGVRCVLEGGVRVAGNKVRVTAQLIDGQSGHHLWAEHYDGELQDIFEVQENIARNIVLAMQVKLTYGELARLWEGQTQSLRAWEKMVQARGLYLRFNETDIVKARQYLKEAIELDPQYYGAMVLLGLTYWLDGRFSRTLDRENSLQQAAELVDRLFSLGHGDSGAHMLRGLIAWLRGQFDQAVKDCQRAVNLAPSDSWAVATLGQVCVFTGEPEQAAATLKAAMRLSPYHPNWYSLVLAWAYLWSGQLDAAGDAARAHLEREPDDPYSYVALATVLSFQDLDREAAAIIADLCQRYPGFGVRDLVRSEIYKEKEKCDRIIDNLRRAGLPE